MGGYRRHNSPTGVSPTPESLKVGFAGVTGVSRPVTNEEHWTLYYFEDHAARCSSCQDPLRLARAGKHLCREGRELAIDVAELLLYRRRDEKVYARTEGAEEVRVEIPRDYEQTLSLLKAINRAVRREENFLAKPRSHDRNYLVTSRASPEAAAAVDEQPQPQPQQLSMRRPYETKVVEPKAPRPASRSRRPRRYYQERESTEDLVADAKRGSLYGEDMSRLERAERRDKEIRYNVEVREPKPRRPLPSYP